MYSRNFKAALKTEDDRFLEWGLGRICFEERFVEFRNEFVPLLQFGTIAKVVRVIDKEETHCFTGRVYLSSRKLLRLIDVKDQILAEAELSLAAKTSIKVHVMPVITDSPLFRTPLRKLVRFEGEIYQISMDCLKFTSEEPFNVGEQLLLHSETPVHLKKVLVEVSQIISFGSQVTGHHCNILSMPEQYRANLVQYMERSNQYFPADPA